MMTIPEIQDHISTILSQYGCSRFGERELRRATRDCRNEVYSDTVAHGGRLEDPFFNFIFADGVAVFTLFESWFSIYVIHCDELELIGETNPLAMSDVEECRRLLFEKYEKAFPDLSVKRSLAEIWLD